MEYLVGCTKVFRPYPAAQRPEKSFPGKSGGAMRLVFRLKGGSFLPERMKAEHAFHLSRALRQIQPARFFFLIFILSLSAPFSVTGTAHASG